MAKPIAGTLSIERVRELLAYESTTGIFTWKVRIAHCIHIGDVAGCTRYDGYRIIGIGRRIYAAARLAWLLTNGAWPVGQIDHINGIPDDDRIANLRDVTNPLNQQNRRKPPRNNNTGVLGVCRLNVPLRIRNKFRATISIKGKKVNLGHFPTIKQAHTAYITAKRKYHPGCAF